MHIVYRRGPAAGRDSAIPLTTSRCCTRTSVSRRRRASTRSVCHLSVSVCHLSVCQAASASNTGRAARGPAPAPGTGRRREAREACAGLRAASRAERAGPRDRVGCYEREVTTGGGARRPDQVRQRGGDPEPDGRPPPPCSRRRARLYFEFVYGRPVSPQRRVVIVAVSVASGPRDDVRPLSAA